MTTVKVSNVSLGATDGELKEFFSFSGDILYLETQSETERSKLAYVTFKDLQGAEIAVLLSGATIGDSSVIVTMAPDYELSLEALASLEPKESPKSPKGNESVLRKAEDVVSSMLAKGFILGKDAIAKAKSLDEKHQLTSTASAKVASLDKKEEDLSEEELKQEVQLYVTRVQDSDQKLQNAALEKFRKRIPESDSPFHTVPETLEFLRPHYATLKNVLKEMNDSTNYLSEILAVLDLGEGEKAPYLDEVDWPELGGKSITDLSKKDLMVELVKHGLGTTKQGKQSAMELRLAVSIRMKENGYFGELRGKPIPVLVEAELKSELRLRLLSVTGSKDELLLRLAKAVNHGIEITEDEKSPATSLAAAKEIKRRDYPLAFLDLEFKQCTILEVGIILVDPKTWNGEKYNATIRQSKEFMKSYVGRPNLPRKYLEDNVSPRFRDVHETVFDCLNGKIVVGHNIHGCDLSRIRDRCFDLDLDAPKPRGVIDTYKWMKDNTLRSLYPELKLADLAVQFELGEQIHRAAEDCLLNIEVFKRVLASKNLFEILETIEGENTEKSDNTRKKRRAG